MSLSESEYSSDRSGAAIQVSFGFVLGLFKELEGIRDGAILIKLLEHIVQALKKIEPGSLFTNDKFSFKLDASLNEARTYLVHLIAGNDTQKRERILAYKVLFLMGIARNSIEDLLVICSLLKSKLN
jgi:hypothetical protein